MSKAHYDLDELGRRLLRSFPTVDIRLPLLRLGEGYASEVLESSNGIVFKVARNHVAQDSYAKEYQLLLFLADKSHGCRIPFPEFYLASSTDFPFGLLGYPKIAGSPLNAETDAELLQSIAASIADFLLQLHSIDLSQSEIARLELESFPPTVEVVRQTWVNVTGWLQTNLTETDFLAVQAYWRALEQFWELNAQPSRLTHGDLWLENILVDRDTHTTGIIDFGSVRLGDPAIDFAVQRYVGEEFRDEVIEQYRRLGGDVGADLDKRMAYLLALREIYGLEYGLMTGHLDPDTLAKVRHTFGLKP